MPSPLWMWKQFARKFAARRVPAARRARVDQPPLRCQRLEDRLTPAQIPLTVLIPRFETIDDPDPDFIVNDDGDYYAIVTIDGVEQPMSSVVTGVNIDPNWSFTQMVDDTKPRIPVTIHIYDQDG